MIYFFVFSGFYTMYIVCRSGKLNDPETVGSNIAVASCFLFLAKSSGLLTISWGYFASYVLYLFIVAFFTAYIAISLGVETKE